MSGVDEKRLIALRSQLETMNSECAGWMHEFVQRQAEEVLERTKQNTPEGMEQLRDSWYAEDVKKVRGKMEITIRNDMETASHVEYGHEDSSHTKWQEGAFVYTFAMEDQQRAMPARFRNEFSKWMKRLGGDVL